MAKLGVGTRESGARLVRAGYRYRCPADAVMMRHGWYRSGSKQ